MSKLELHADLYRELTKYLKSLHDAMEKGGEFALEQAPLYCQEVVRWQIIKGFLVAVPTGILLVFAMYFATKAWNRTKDAFNRDDEEEAATNALILVITVSGICILPFIFCTHFLSAMQAIVAPRVVIIEHLSKLL